MFSSFSHGNTLSITTDTTCFFRRYLWISKNRTFERRARASVRQEHPRPRSIRAPIQNIPRQNISGVISRSDDPADNRTEAFVRQYPVDWWILWRLEISHVVNATISFSNMSFFLRPIRFLSNIRVLSIKMIVLDLTSCDSIWRSLKERSISIFLASFLAYCHLIIKDVSKHRWLIDEVLRKDIKE